MKKSDARAASGGNQDTLSYTALIPPNPLDRGNCSSICLRSGDHRDAMGYYVTFFFNLLVKLKVLQGLQSDREPHPGLPATPLERGIHEVVGLEEGEEARLVQSGIPASAGMTWFLIG
jgi:hypothetical protein